MFPFRHKNPPEQHVRLVYDHRFPIQRGLPTGVVAIGEDEQGGRGRVNRQFNVFWLVGGDGD